MTTIKATKGDFVHLINGLYQVQDIKGKDFSISVSKNISILHEALKEIEKAGTPSEEFMKLAQKVNELSSKDPENSKVEIDKLEKENEELVKLRKEQMDNVTELMKDEMSVDLTIVSEKILPEDITAKQINTIEKIINN